jgi:ABC-2 type transport system ATP-binding protein
VTGASPAVLVEALTHHYRERTSLRRYRARTALAGVSFSVADGEIFGLLGPNGGGKTTLFRIIATLLTPSAGAVRVFGRDAVRESHAVRRLLGVVFQDPALDDRLTVGENLMHHGHLYGLMGSELDRRGGEVLDVLGLKDRARERVRTLSGGLQRRVELAKALLPRPRVLLLDEPSTGLDPGARRDLWAQLQTFRRQFGTTVLMTTHLMEEAAGCDRVAILHEGALVALGRPADLTATVGGDVLWISAREPARVAEALSARFQVGAEVVEGRVRLERPRAHEFIPVVIEAFPGEVDSVTFSRPTLEDVFVHHTGRRLAHDE